jgi:polysaccharide pyruvyl transferase WcaK-like protein
LKRELVYFIDPYIGKNIITVLSGICSFVCNRKKIYKIAKQKYGKINISSLLSASMFYRQYSNFFDDDILFNAKYIEHYVTPSTEEENFRCADELLKKYANAKLIITSRIHAALPATGMNTPCIFILPQNISDVELCRFSGLLDFFNVMYHTGYAIKNNDHIDTLNPEIKQNYAPFKAKLMEILSEKLSHYDT